MKVNIKDYIVDENINLIECLDRLDKVKIKVLFVVRGDTFVASITDGDVRRWLLKKGELDEKIKQFANYNPKYFFEEDIYEAKKTLKKEHQSIEAFPILDKNRKIVDIIFREEDVNTYGNLDIPVVIMAGGLGTRLYPYTKILPKPLIPIGEIPISEHIINSFRKFGVKRFLMILNHKKNMIKAYFNELDKDYDVEYYDEDIPLGTGGGLSLLKGKIDSTFILSNCDILIDENYQKIYTYHKDKQNIITMICSVKNFKIPYGVVEISEKGELEEMKEKPNLSFFTNTGVYIVEPKVIEELEYNKVIGFPDIIQQYKDRGEKIGIYPVGEQSWMDMGQLDEMEKMIKKLEV